MRDEGSNSRSGKRGGGGGGSRKKKRCKKQKFRDYFIEPNGCRSKRPYKMARCMDGSGGSGGGGAPSCVANKTKMRKIRFVCDDGRQFRKEVEIIKRCGKSKTISNK